MIDVSSLSMLSGSAASGAVQSPAMLTNKAASKAEVREAFDNFVGQTFFSQMLSSLRETVGKPAYFHGGRAEEVFQGQLDQIMAEDLSEASAEQFTQPMFELFMLQRP